MVSIIYQQLTFMKTEEVRVGRRISRDKCLSGSMLVRKRIVIGLWATLSF